jgi:predicted acyltransferase
MTDNEQQGQAGARLVSIDALRGFTMLWIIGAAAVIKRLAQLYPNRVTRMLAHQMEHAGWEGCTFMDLIFPLFLFIVGVVLPFSIYRHLEKGERHGRLYLHIVKRTAVLVLFGLINYGLLRFDWPNMRWSSVLGRIGICYFFASLLVLHTKWRSQLSVAAMILVLYWLAVILVPVPGHGPGVLTPEGCLTTYLDQLLIPGKLGLELYDRQGVLSTFTALATTLMGVLAGHWLRSQRSNNHKVAGLACAGLLSLLAGYVWGEFFVMSRNIWSSPFVLVAGGWSLLLLALFYWVIDVKGYRRWTFFFVVIGMNAITIWVGQHFIDFDEIAAYFLRGAAGLTGSYQPLILACGALSAKWLLLWFLYRNKIFFRA